MNSRFRLSLALGGLFLVFLVASAPAGLLGLLVPADALVMQGFRGSIWRGSAARALVAVGHGYVHLGSVEWRLVPLSLLTLSPTVDLKSRWGSQSLSAQITLKGAESFDLRDVQATASAQLLRQFAPFSVDGDFSVQLEHLVIRDGMPRSITGQLVWQRAAWLSPQGSRPLGSYALDFKPSDNEVLIAELETLVGPVIATGDVQLKNRHYIVDVMLDSAEGLDVQLQQAVSLIGQPVSEGFHIKLEGEI